MILEGPLVLPREWEQRIAARPRAQPKLLDPDRIRIGRTLKSSQVFHLMLNPESEWTDRTCKVAEFDATLNSKPLRLNVFIYREILKSHSWSTLQLAFKTRDDEATLERIYGQSREFIAQVGATLRKLGVADTSTLRIHPTSGILNAITLTWTGLAFRFSALERFAKPLGIDVVKLRRYREEIEELLKAGEQVCGTSAVVGELPYQVQGKAEAARVVARLEELGWVRNVARSGNSPDRGFHYFQRGKWKLTANLIRGGNFIQLESGWREPFASPRSMPYVKG